MQRLVFLLWDSYFLVSYCAMLLVLVANERRASACLIMLSAKQGSQWYHFKAFGTYIFMALLSIEPTTTNPKADALPLELLGTVLIRIVI